MHSDGLRNMHPTQKANMEKIAAEEGNRVLKWEWDTATVKRSAAEVRNMFQETQEAFLELLANETGVAEAVRKNKEAENERLRKKLANSDPVKYKAFYSTHPMIFTEATKLPPFEPPVGSSSEEQDAYRDELDNFRKSLAAVNFMLSMRERVESGELSQMTASQVVQKYNMQLWNTGKPQQKPQQ